MGEDDQSAILSTTGFSAGALPLIYLGAPLYRGRTLKSYFHYLEDRVRDRIHGWAKNFLSLGGRITLVNAVLNAISIHVMMVLPIPKGVLDRIISLMSSFIWDARGEKRRHWIGWERLCCSKEYGGLGIRDPHHIMLALHGKLAWSFVSSESLWARYARSRFRVGQPGSPLWNAIDHLIPTVQSMGTWKIGNGETMISDICAKLGVNPPPNIKREKLCHVLENEGQRMELTLALPVGERPNFDQIYFTDRKDFFVWKHSPDGRFSSRIFFENFQTRYGVVGWGALIFRPEIPPKVSCFLWKVFHKVVPTDDNIQRLGIPLVSRCSCCVSPCSDSTAHLLFHGDWARVIWAKLSTIFDRGPPRGLASLQLRWLKARKKNYVDDLAAILAGCAIWELWKARNLLIYEGKTRDVWKACCRWAAKLYGLIKSPYPDSPFCARVLGILRLPKPHLPKAPPRWLSWKPPDLGLSMNIGSLLRDGRLAFGGLIRGARGGFVVAVVYWCQPMPFLEALDRFLGIIHELACLHRLPIRYIHSSHHRFDMLSDGEEEVPGDCLQRRRGILSRWPDARFRRVNPASNHAAIALVCTTTRGTFWGVSALHLAARRAIRADALGIRVSEDSLLSFPSEVHDDLRVQRFQRNLGLHDQDDFIVSYDY